MSRAFNKYRLNLVGHRPSRRANRTKLFKEFPETLKIDVEITTGFCIRETGTITGEVITGFGVDVNGNINFTGYSGYSYPYDYEIKNLNSFSGFNFYSDISVGQIIRQQQVNLGASNKSVNGSKAGIIGNANTAIASFTGLSIKNDFSQIIGTANTLDKSRDAIIFGSKSKIDSANLSISIGDNNQITNSTWNNLNIGFSNLISGFTGAKSADSYNIGWSNKSVNVSGVKVFGESNSITSVKDALVLGENISLQNSDQINVVGKGLSIKEGYYDTVIGNNNVLDYTYENTLLGVDSEIFDSTKVYLVGKNNLSTGDNSNCIVGKDNESTLNKDSHILGDDNLISNSTNLRFLGNSSEINKLIDSVSIGERNKLDDSYGVTVLGKGNQISGVFDGLIVGQYNRQDHTALEDLHRVALTGAAGNITGYYYSNSYYNGNATPKTAGDDLYVFGKSNDGTENYSSFVFGEENIGIENYKSYVVGNQNTIEKTNNSFIFGGLNKVSGNANCVIGRNNILSSGNQSSILIGVSHEPIEKMTAEVRLASVSNHISVKSSEINIASSSPVRFNGSNYFITSDQVNGDIISSSTSVTQDADGFFVDNSYDKVPEYIRFGVVSDYNLNGADRYYTVVNYGTGIGSEKKTFNLTSYFNRIENNSQNIVSQGLNGFVPDSSGHIYISNNRKFYTVWQSGKWHLKDFNTHSYLFNITSSNTGSMPLNGWQSVTNPNTSGISLISHIDNTNFDYYPDLTAEESDGLYTQKIGLDEILKRQSSNVVNAYTSWWTLGGQYAYMSTGGYSIVYGKPIYETNSGFLPRWAVIDTYSSGVYLINQDDSIGSNNFPWSGWFTTGYGGIGSAYRSARPTEFILTGSQVPEITGTYKINIPQSNNNKYIYYNQYNTGIAITLYQYGGPYSSHLTTFASGTDQNDEANLSAYVTLYGGSNPYITLHTVIPYLYRDQTDIIGEVGFWTGISKIQINTNIHSLSGTYTADTVPSGRLYYNNNRTGVYLRNDGSAFFFHSGQTEIQTIENLFSYFATWTGPNMVTNDILYTGFDMSSIYNTESWEEYPATGLVKQTYTVFRDETTQNTYQIQKSAWVSGISAAEFNNARDLNFKMKASQNKLFRINIPTQSFGVGYLEVKY